MRVWAQAEAAARTHGRAALLLDEVRHVGDWARRLKAEWDRLRRRKVRVHLAATGPSALRVNAGSRESLAGRFERLVLGHWSAGALARAFGLAPDEAMALLADPPRWTAYVRDAVVEPAVGRDLTAPAAVRRPALLRQLFGLCAASPARVVSLQKLQGCLQDAAALETIAHYLRLL